MFYIFFTLSPGSRELEQDKKKGDRGVAVADGGRCYRRRRRNGTALELSGKKRNKGYCLFWSSEKQNLVTQRQEARAEANGKPTPVTASRRDGDDETKG